MKRVKDGLIPTVIGSAVTVGAIALRVKDMQNTKLRKKDVVPRVETAVLGFGLAHVVLGAMDLVQNR